LTRQFFKTYWRPESMKALDLKAGDGIEVLHDRFLRII